MFATAGAEYDPVYITFGICCWRDVNAFGAQREQILPSLRLGSGKLEPCFNSRRLARRHEARKSSQTLHHRAWDLTRSGSSDSKSYQPIACTGYLTKYPRCKARIRRSISANAPLPMAGGKTSQSHKDTNRAMQARSTGSMAKQSESEYSVPELPPLQILRGARWDGSIQYTGTLRPARLEAAWIGRRRIHREQ